LRENGMRRRSFCLLYSVVKREGEWRITHGHSTVIDPNAQPFDPIKTGWTG
jgi:hypothetical protein